jgi:hypothetical protein
MQQTVAAPLRLQQGSEGRPLVPKTWDPQLQEGDNGSTLAPSHVRR